MATVTADHNLLLGTLALQMHYIRIEDLVAAVKAWQADKSASLAEILEERGVLTGEQRRMLEAMVRTSLDIFGDDPQRSLAAVPLFLAVREALAPIANEELHATLASVTAGPAPGETAWVGPSVVARAAQVSANEPSMETLAPTGSFAPTERDAVDPQATQPHESPEAAADPYGTVAHDLDDLGHDPYATVDVSAVPEDSGDITAKVGGAETTEAMGDVPAGPGRPGTRRSGSRYHALRKHAQGGLGEIFVAFDDELGREVALKEIKGRFADHGESRLRFQFEAEVTGGLEHPGVVPVYGLGRYGDGRPYYAMRFIRGQSLKAAIRRLHETVHSDPSGWELERRELLQRFIDVCNTIDYAHSRHVLHRDLKPDNVMLGPYGETLVVDWGLAKPLDRPDLPRDPEVQPLRPASGSSMIATQFGSTVGTPAYMPPEQAAGLLDEMGPPSDIYSLGAILYQILTGKAPFDEPTLTAILHKVRHGEFTKPRERNPAVPGALEAVCLKAMALRPQDRYASGRELARDIERWLADEPVSCYIEPLPVRLARWGRRHKTGVTGGAAALIVAVVGLSVGSFLLSREKARTERNYERARQAVEQMLTGVGSVELADVPQMEEVRRGLLERARRFYDEFLRERGNETGLRRDTAGALVRLGMIREQLGDYRAAEEAYQKSISTLTALGSENPSDVSLRRDLGEAWQGLGVLLKQSSRYRESEQALREAVKLRTALAEGSREDSEDRQALISSRYQLGALLARTPQGRSKEDEELYRRALEDQQKLVAARRGDPAARGELARYLNNMGILLAATGRPKEAAQSFAEADKTLTDLIQVAPSVPRYRWLFARTDSNWANLQSAHGGVEEAKALIQRALEQQESLAADYPRIPAYRQELAVIHSNLGLLLAKAKQPKEAEAEQRKALAYQERLAAEFPGIPEYQHRLALTYLHLGLGLETEKPREAESLYRKALGIQDKLFAEFPNATEYESALGKTHADLARLLATRGETTEALRVLDAGIKHDRATLKVREKDPQFRLNLLDALATRAVILKQARDHAGAASSAEEIAGEAAGDVTGTLRAAALLSQCVALAGADEKLAETRRKELVRDYTGKALAVLRKAGELSPITTLRAMEGKDFEPLRTSGDFEKLRKALDSRVHPGQG